MSIPQFEENEGIRWITNRQGPVLGLAAGSGVPLIEQDGLWFKNLSKDGTLKKYEDWRLPADERAEDLASRMSVEQIAGLMLYSSHQAVPGLLGFTPSTYGGKPFERGVTPSYELSDQQIRFIEEDHLRHILVTSVESPEAAVRWSNGIQALAERAPLGIPANNSSDPRHGSDASAEYNAGAGGKISMWPEPLGMAATFDPGIARLFGQVAAREYRALGLTTALSPQIDLATDPRWSRFRGTFGEDAALVTDIARASIDGYQTSEGEADNSGAWGYDSVNTMVKHWPGGGTGEGGRDAHFGYGKYAVYPGGNFEEHLKPFVMGAFNLDDGTGSASAVMPYYTISYNQDPADGENVGNSYSSYIIRDLLRDKYGYDGVVCTDWGITADEPEDITKLFPGGRCWGVEEGISVAERHYRLLMAGVDQFGGNDQAAPLLEAYRIGTERHGEEYMRRRFERSAVRLLRNMFRVGLFENPYLSVQKAGQTVGCAEYMKLGYEAQLKSVVMLKNAQQLLPITSRKTVYIPPSYTPARTDWFGNQNPEAWRDAMNPGVVSKYFRITTNPDEADFAIVCMKGPDSGTGYSREDVREGGNGYVPISLQYGPYTARQARERSLAGDPRGKDVLNRSYLGKSVTAANIRELEILRETRARMAGKPVIVSLLLAKPCIVSEFEAEADALLVHFGVQDQVLLDMMSGASEPSGLLPMQLPADMETVEAQCEDQAHDMRVHSDAQGHAYDFAFGLNWSGVIQDERTQKYSHG